MPRQLIPVLALFAIQAYSQNCDAGLVDFGTGNPPLGSTIFIADAITFPGNGPFSHLTQGVTVTASRNGIPATVAITGGVGVGTPDDQRTHRQADFGELLSFDFNGTLLADVQYQIGSNWTDLNLSKRQLMVFGKDDVLLGTFEQIGYETTVNSKIEISPLVDGALISRFTLENISGDLTPAHGFIVQRVSGDITAVPEPGSFLFLGGLGFTSLYSAFTDVSGADNVESA